MSKKKGNDEMLKGQNFENYFTQHMVQEWRDRYFNYGQIKRLINQKYQMMVAKIKQEKAQQSGGEDPKFINFSGKETNKEYLDFLSEVREVIKEDFSSVSLHFLDHLIDMILI